MDQAAFVNTARSAKHGQLARIKFKDGLTGITALMRLARGYAGHDGFEIVEKDKTIVDAVLTSRNWDGNKNRTIGFVGIHTIEEPVLYQFGKGVDNIVLV